MTSGTETAWYVDTSAAAKLIVDEEHSGAMRRWAETNAEGLLASDLLRAELLRAARRVAAGSDDVVADVVVLRAQAVVDANDLVPHPRHLLRDAGLLDPPVMRTLDALHLVVALSLGDDLDGLVTYDDRMADAARRHGVEVIGPD
jgi:predicted nucleic acid-binding protein